MNGSTIARVRALAVRIPRDATDARRTAGSPAAPGAPAGPRYHWAETYRTVYSDHLETVLVSIETSDGVVGWGEAQAPVAPEIVCTAIDTLLGPLLIGEDSLAPEAIWDRLYAAMRVRGHTGGFLLDAIAGIDLAIWDVCGKSAGLPVARLLGGPVRATIPCYVSGLAGDSIPARVAEAERRVEQGASAFKIFHAGTETECLDELDALRDAFGNTVLLAVDALWRLDRSSAVRFASRLVDREVAWLEAPLMPEDVAGHAALARSTPIPIAIGESYRTRFEVRPFFERDAVGLLQPDLGRSGLTETRKLAVLADTFHVGVAPHVSIGLGPQLAAGLHFAVSTTNLTLLECNPRVQEIANRFLLSPLPVGMAGLHPPDRPGLGADIDLERIASHITLETETTRP